MSALFNQIEKGFRIVLYPLNIPSLSTDRLYLYLAFTLLQLILLLLASLRFLAPRTAVTARPQAKGTLLFRLQYYCINCITDEQQDEEILLVP